MTRPRHSSDFAPTARVRRAAVLRNPAATIGRICLCVLGLRMGAAAGDWPRFRGPDGAGVSTLQGVPREWTQNDYEWVVELPGKGHSSPVIWGEHLFVASGDEDGKRMLICLNATTGSRLWMQTVTLAGEHGLHLKNSYGSGTAATDGERVYVSYADNDHYQLAAFDFDNGSPVWTADLGPFVSQHGHGLSPVLFGHLVIATNDQKGPSFIAAFQRETGEEVWRTPRAVRETSYATPMVLDVDGRQPQLICLSGATGVVALDPSSGTELWGTGEMPMRTLASPVYGAGVIIASCGKGGRGHHMLAVEPPAGLGSLPKTRWERTTMLPYVPTPIVHNGLLYLWTDDGVVCSVDLQTGETIGRVRVGGTYSGSPVLIDGHLYGPSEEGEIVVLSTTPELKVVGRSPLGDRIHSTPAVGNGRVYFRG
ncbi:MAG: PQQ-binding-like beta-propeller repeat protein, partial [Planctomycetaceae bacterium]